MLKRYEVLAFLLLVVAVLIGSYDGDFESNMLKCLNKNKSIDTCKHKLYS